MYSIYADDVCIYSDVFALDNMKVLNPKLTLEDNAAGSLTMTLPASNIGYSSISRLTTKISVQKDGEELWAGRVLQESKDFYNNRVLYCEGELAFFNDTTQPPNEYTELSIYEYLRNLITVHNSKAPATRRFTIGDVTVVDSNRPTYYTNHEKTMELLNALVEKYGGHLRIRKENGIRYLDYLADYPHTCTQVIQFGRNLIDFTRNWDSTEFATVIVPLGSRLNDRPDDAIEALDARLTVESVNNNSMYVQSSNAMRTYGWIEKVVTWDEVTEPEVLLEKARAYLTDLQFEKMELELSAIDLHYLDVDYEAVKLLDKIRVISHPHGLDRDFPVTKLEIPLDNPDQTQFKMGDTVKTSLTSVNNQINAAILHKIEGLPKEHSLLKKAKDNATAIMNMATTGYITIVKNEAGSEAMYISDNPKYTEAQKLWKWSMGGLGYSNDGGKTYGLAITMDGSIVADYITTGVLNADRIRTGMIQDYKFDKDGNLMVDEEGNAIPVGNVIFDLKTGTLTMKKGSISIGSMKVTNDKGQEETVPNFSVSTDGSFIARSGTLYGRLEGVTGKFKGTVQAENFLDKDGYSMMDKAREKFTGGYLDLYGVTVYKRGTKDITFKVDGMTGEVTINGKVKMGEGSSINWDEVDDNGALAAANAAQSTANIASTAASNANTKIDKLKKVPDYIETTRIFKAKIESPTIEGNEIAARGCFKLQTVDEGYGTSVNTHGYMGKAKGKRIIDTGWGEVTTPSYGVAMCSGITSLDGGFITFDSNGTYVIATEAGVRMTYKQGNTQHSITVTANGCFADGVKIGGSATAVWGSDE